MPFPAGDMLTAVVLCILVACAWMNCLLGGQNGAQKPRVLAATATTCAKLGLLQLCLQYVEFESTRTAHLH